MAFLDFFFLDEYGFYKLNDYIFVKKNNNNLLLFDTNHSFFNLIIEDSDYYTLSWLFSKYIKTNKIEFSWNDFFQLQDKIKEILNGLWIKYSENISYDIISSKDNLDFNKSPKELLDNQYKILLTNSFINKEEYLKIKKEFESTKNFVFTTPQTKSPSSYSSECCHLKKIPIKFDVNEEFYFLIEFAFFFEKLDSSFYEYFINKRIPDYKQELSKEHAFLSFNKIISFYLDEKNFCHEHDFSIFSLISKWHQQPIWIREIKLISKKDNTEKVLVNRKCYIEKKEEEFILPFSGQFPYEKEYSDYWVYLASIYWNEHFISNIDKEDFISISLKKILILLNLISKTVYVEACFEIEKNVNKLRDIKLNQKKEIEEKAYKEFLEILKIKPLDKETQNLIEKSKEKEEIYKKIENLNKQIDINQLEIKQLLEELEK